MQLGKLNRGRDRARGMSLEQPLLSGGEDSGLQVGYGKSTSEEPEKIKNEDVLSPA